MEKLQAAFAGNDIGQDVIGNNLYNEEVTENDTGIENNSDTETASGEDTQTINTLNLNSSVDWEITTDADTGRQYWGFYNENGKLQGVGKEVYENGTGYRGEFEDGQRQGYGIYRGEDSNVIYQGNFENGKYNGFGIQLFYNDNSDQERYEGYWENDKIVGWGILWKKDGSFTAGKWEDGALQTDSEIEKWEDEQGVTYIGTKKNGVIDGEGICIYEGGMRYIGEFSDGIREGSGVWIMSDESYLIGEFKNDEPQGGIIEYNMDGSYMIAFADDGCVYGPVIIVFSFGEILNAISKEDEPYGRWVWLKMDGTVKTGIWDNTVKTGIWDNMKLNEDCYWDFLEHIKDDNYDAVWDDGKQVEGTETEIWAGEDGSYYIGTKENGKLQGEGAVITEEGVMIIGSFKAGKYQGDVGMFGSWYNGASEVYCCKISTDSNGEEETTFLSVNKKGMPYTTRIPRMIRKRRKR